VFYGYIGYYNTCTVYISCTELISIGGTLARGGSAFVSNNEVNLHRARLVRGWVTVSGFNFRCGTFISVCNQPPRSTQPGTPSWVGAMSTSQCDDALRLCGWGVKADMVRVWVAGTTA